MMRFSVPILLLCAMPVSAAPVPERVPDLVKVLQNGKLGERVIAAEMLGDLGAKAESAIPALAEVIRNTPTPVPIYLSERKWSREESAAHFLLEASWDALTRIGPKAVPALVELLAHKDVEIRGRAAAVLKTFGPDAADAVPALIKRLDGGEDQRVCSNVLAALAAIGPKAEAAIPALILTVLDPKAVVAKEEGSVIPLRAEAARALKAIGPKALPAVKDDLFPVIIQALDDPNGAGKFHSGFGSIDDPDVWMPFGADAAPLVPALVRHLNRHNKSFLIASLLKLGPDGQKALAGLLSDKDERTRRERFLALGKHSRLFFGPRGVDFSPIVPQVIPFLTDEDHYVRLVALVCLDRSCPTVPPEVTKAALPLLDDTEFLIEFLKYLNNVNGRSARRADLARLCGPTAIPKLLKYLKSDDKELREGALRELEGVASANLQEYLKSDDKELREGAVLALSGSHRLDAEALRELATGKKKHPDITPLEAAIKVARISLDPKDVELLVPFWTSKGPEDRGLYQFVDLRHLARPHLKHLFAVLKDQDAQYREIAAKVISEVIRSDPEARAALDKWIVDSGYDGPFVKQLKPGVSEALKMFKPGKQYDPGRGCYLVQQIGPAAKDAVPYLVPYLAREFDDPVMQKVAEGLEPDDVLRALGAIGPGAKDAVPLLRKQLAKAEDREKTWYLLCLTDIGPGGKDAVPDLKELLIDPNPRLRLLAACALSKIEANPAAYRATFAHLIHERPKCALWDVSGVFERIAADNPELVPVVVRGLVRLDNVDLIMRLGGDIDTVIPALKRNASAAKAAVPDLVNYLNTARRVVPEFIELLGAIGPDAKAALPQLRELLNDSDFEIIIAAHGAIQKIEAKK
jgi:HEAT repeat protein